MRTASKQVQLDLLYYFALLSLALLSLFGEGWYLYTTVAEHWFKQKTPKSLQMDSSQYKVLYDESNSRAFHPGVLPKLTKAQKRKKQEERKRQRERVLRLKNTRPFSRPAYQSWVILPCSIDYRFMMDMLPGKTYLSKMKSLHEYGSFYTQSKDKSNLFPNYQPDPKFLKDLKERKKQCAAFMKENQRLRWIFRRFLIRWRIQRFRCINDSDFITLNPIQKPIPVIIFSSQCKYIFSAHSLLQHIHKRLLHNDGQIPDPLAPCNPYTNEPFTLSQLLGIQAALKNQGKSSWAFESFARAQFHLERFLSIYRKPLRFHALRTILYDYSDWEGRSVLLNFMDTHHEEHSAIFQKQLYSFFLRELPEEEKIQRWRSLCREYYEQEILAEDEDERLNAFYRVRAKTGPLCAPPHDLFVKRSFFLRTKKDGSQSSGNV